METMRREFRGDIAEMRERIADATALPRKHTNELLSSLGLSSGQVAQLVNQLLRGDLDGILQQMLAPLAYSTAGKISAEETMPIFIRQASIKGPLLPSAIGLSIEGELSHFSWPLEIAEEAAVLELRGRSMAGGSLQLDVRVDHRSTPENLVTITIEQLPLRDMVLSDDEELTITLRQTLATVSGQMSLQGEALAGNITHNYAQTVIETSLAEDASQAARLLSLLLESSDTFTTEMGISGTVGSPVLSFDADFDQLLRRTILTVLETEIGGLTVDLQNHISDEIGPQIAHSREQFAKLEALENALLKRISELR